jgi:hypothetical protein
MIAIEDRMEELAQGMFYAGLSEAAKHGSPHHSIMALTWENVSEWERIRHRRMAQFAYAETLAKDAVVLARDFKPQLDGAGHGGTANSAEFRRGCHAMADWITEAIESKAREAVVLSLLAALKAELCGRAS